MATPHPRPEWLESAGKKDGRYLLGPLLGHGGMGDVYEAWDTLLGRLVALKVLIRLEPASMVRFMHEARLQARFEHPNICRIYDIEAHGGAPRIAMQLVRGPTLEDAARDLELAEVVTLTARLAEILGDAHRGGLIHRDVKPGNVLLEWQETGGWNPVICDFGLALALNESSLTQPNALTGTPAYMAPEQVRGDRRLICPATDVYGLGSTLYFLLLGRPPCVSTVTKEMLRVKKDQRFPKPRSLEPAIPAELEAILLKCLAPDPGDRYPTMAVLAKELRGFLGQGPAGRAQAGPSGRPARRPWLAASAALVLVGGLGGLAWRHGISQARWSELASRAAQEAQNLDLALAKEESLPRHDIRPALVRLREASGVLAGQYEAMGPEVAGPQALVRGQAQLALGEYAEARTNLERAWADGLHMPETAFLAGLACAEDWLAETQLAAYRGDPPPPADEARTWLQRARGLSRDREEYAAAFLALMDGDPAGAVEHARTSQEANPWRLEATPLGCLCLIRLARQNLLHGDPQAALRAYREAQQWAQAGLGRAPSCGRLHHAFLAAALGQAALAQNRGGTPAMPLDQLARLAAQALEINPDAPAAQGDWLSVQALRAMAQRARGQDPRGTLEEALAFYWTRTQEPRPPALRVAHMVLYWQMAEREADKGGAPDAPLAEALKDAGHALDSPRDYLGDLLHFKATLETARTPDPRPSLRLTRRQADPRAATPAT